MIAKLNPDLRQVVQKATQADSTMCWTCSSCDAECPVEIATNRLRPQRIVRLANLGLIEELIVSPEIWYCQTCRRCTHVCPNLLGPIIVYATLTVPAVMLEEAFLSFLGLGVQPPNSSWGLLAAEGASAITALDTAWWLILFPGLALGVTLFALNFLGDGLRDALDPRLRNR